ncbi:p-type atpase [Stylonychia lemnae]|uniref:Phospholipid-transporting ATPase n=1 Tax=Stylonychia lemnae TaxID=5949 RepID=A0A077ZXL5_STYLE|nr:p-type atpase [Stylonychia lemnae]|eukprot:CDW74651.1 p-type atpase [Stylonychia lemnae]
MKAKGDSQNNSIPAIDVKITEQSYQSKEKSPKDCMGSPDIQRVMPFNDNQGPQEQIIPQSQSYKFYINSSPNKKDKRFARNQIKTSKYTWYNFIPKNLYLQFSKVNNAYFLVILVLQVLKYVSLTGGKPSVLLGLSTVILISAVKDIIEDIKRSQSDSQENNSITEVYDKYSKAFTKTQWRNVKIGQIVKIHNRQNFPADLLMVGSSNQQGICYVETKGLDGETALKTKKQMQQSSIIGKISEDNLYQLEGTIECEFPNDYIYRYQGIINLQSQEIGRVQQEVISIGIDNLLLRGSSLQNTDYIFGIVVYAGHDSKVMKNSKSSRTKFSRNDKFIYRQTLFMLIVQFSLCLFCSLYGAFLDQGNQTTKKYLQVQQLHSNSHLNILLMTLQNLGYWFQILQHLIPISLIITLESVRFIYAFFISWDADIYDIQNDRPPKIQSSNLNEELGQVTHIFSDKTGTLTQNIMNFRQFSIGKYSYGFSSGDYNSEMIRRNVDYLNQGITNVNFDDESFYENLYDKNSENNEQINEMLLAMALTHEAVIDKHSEDGKICYNSSSPDELALVNAAAFFGFRFIKRDNLEGTISILTRDCMIRTFKILNTFEFDSDRKRMSVIVQDENQDIKMYSKGADSVMLELLNKDFNNMRLSSTTQDFLNEYANHGLRTLVYASKDIEQIEYEIFKEKFTIAANSINDREQQLSKVAQYIEKDLNLLGSTAIEDVLQEDVEQTIMDLRKANIKVWLLTGDKVETAVSIGHSCSLLSTKINDVIISQENSFELMSKLNNIKEEYLQIGFKKDYSLIVTGSALILIMEDDSLKMEFLDIAKCSKVVLACRVSPKLKADIVRLVKQNIPNEITLAIGDGANDVSMITEAHIGIGISGKEGQQASRASDYAIGQFKFLKNLLFVHGRESYRRNSYLSFYMYYKNIIYISSQLWFAFLNQFSAQTIFELWIQQVYNIIFTSLPVIWFAVFDQQHSRKYLLSKPSTYKKGPQKRHLNSKVFWAYVLYAFSQSLFVMYMACYSFESSVNPEGNPASFWILGQIIYCAIVFIVNVEIFYQTYSHSIFSIVFVYLSILSFFIFYKIQDSVKFIPDMKGTFFFIWRCPAFYFMFIFIFCFQIILQNAIRWAYNVYKQALRKSDFTQIVLNIVETDKNDNPNQNSPQEDNLLQDSRRKRGKTFSIDFDFYKRIQSVKEVQYTNNFLISPSKRKHKLNKRMSLNLDNTDQQLDPGNSMVDEDFNCLQDLEANDFSKLEVAEKIIQNKNQI